jgi:TniQ
MEIEPHPKPAESAMTPDSRAEPQLPLPGIRQLPGLTKPVQDETVKSYLQRLARANCCAIEDLASYLAPHTLPHDDAKASDFLIASLHDWTSDIFTGIELSALAKATGLPEASLAYALPELRDQYADARSMVLRGRNIAGHPNYVGLACQRCMAAKGITTNVYVWMRHDQIVCLRHKLWIGPGAHSAGGQLDLAKVPQVVAAQRKHRALIRRLRRRWVFAVFPQAFEFADSWVPTKTRRQRLAQLRAPRGYPPGKFPFRGAHWNAAIYPEAVALTGVLASPRWRSSGLPADDDESLQLIVQQIRTRVLPDYDPGQGSEPIFEWLTLLHDPSEKRLGWGEVRRYEEDVMARETGTKPSQSYYEFLPPRLGGTGRLSARSYSRGPKRVRAR